MRGLGEGVYLARGEGEKEIGAKEKGKSAFEAGTEESGHYKRAFSLGGSLSRVSKFSRTSRLLLVFSALLGALSL